MKTLIIISVLSIYSIGVTPLAVKQIDTQLRTYYTDGTLLEVETALPAHLQTKLPVGGK